MKPEPEPAGTRVPGGTRGSRMARSVRMETTEGVTASATAMKAFSASIMGCTSAAAGAAGRAAPCCARAGATRAESARAAARAVVRSCAAVPAGRGAGPRRTTSGMSGLLVGPAGGRAVWYCVRYPAARAAFPGARRRGAPVDVELIDGYLYIYDGRRAVSAHREGARRPAPLRDPRGDRCGVGSRVPAAARAAAGHAGNRVAPPEGALHGRARRVAARRAVRL